MECTGAQPATSSGPATRRCQSQVWDQNDDDDITILILLSGLSGPAVYSSPAVSLYPDSYTLSWTAESKTEITSFRVLYRLKGAGGKQHKWSEMKISPRQSSIDPQGGGTWEGSALLSQLRSASQYEAKVMPENFFGLSQPEKAFNFATKGAGWC